MRQWFLVRRANWSPTPVGTAFWDFTAAKATLFMPSMEASPAAT
jgi:hypothetical protein